MLVPLLLATALAQRVQHLPVHQAVQTIAVRREEPQKIEAAEPDMFAYCDVRHQPTIMLTNTRPAVLLVEWALTAAKPPYPPDHWSGVSRLEPGQFEGWMSPAAFLHLDIRYDEDGLSTTKSIDASCQATAGMGGGLEDGLEE